MNEQSKSVDRQQDSPYTPRRGPGELGTVPEAARSFVRSTPLVIERAAILLLSAIALVGAVGAGRQLSAILTLTVVTLAAAGWVCIVIDNRQRHTARRHLLTECDDDDDLLPSGTDAPDSPVGSGYHG